MGYINIFTCNRYFPPLVTRVFVETTIKPDFFIIWKFTSSFNVYLQCFLTRTTSASPWKYFQLSHRPLEQPTFYRYLIILRIYPVAAIPVAAYLILLSNAFFCTEIASLLLLLYLVIFLKTMVPWSWFGWR